MSTATNKQLIVDAYAAVAEGNRAVFVDLLSDDVRYTSFGSHRFATTFHGKDDMRKNMWGPLREILQGPVKTHVKNVIAEGDQVVVEARGEARAKDGRDYNNDYCFVLTLKEGKIIEIREYLDTELAKTVLG